MSTPLWQPGTMYQPGAIVTPRAPQNIVTQQAPNNNSFETGLTSWTITGQYCTNAAAIGAVSASASKSYDGSQSATISPLAGDGTGPTTGNGNPVAYAILTNTYQAPVKPGQKINFTMRAYHNFVPDTSATFAPSAGARIAWFDSSFSFLSYSYATSCSGGSGSTSYPGQFSFGDSTWVSLSGSAVAPAGAAYASAVCVLASTVYTSQAWYVDYFTWDYTHQGLPNGLVFVATQTVQGASSSVEPTWPTANGATVVDNQVTWTAEFASQITWKATPILKSGATEPAIWPPGIGGTIGDNTIEWMATDGRIKDVNCPQSKIVAIASAKVFAADHDIIRFSATANAQDWTTANDAGFIPFGLQSYGNEDCKALGLYRSNLLAFNSLGYQMWQVDPDPANIAILDAEPVGCTYNRTGQPVNNDFVFLNPVGLRNIGTAGAAGNLQAGQFGKNVDPIVKGFIKALATTGYEPRGLFNPGTGQYWLMIGKDVVVLTINGGTVMSWSRYSFPAVITDWTVMDGILYLRADDLVWQLDEAVFNDDCDLGTGQGGTNNGFPGYMSWNYQECGSMGIDKQMEGFDLTIGAVDDNGLITNNDVACNVSFGYNQANFEQVTAPYKVTGDTTPGTMIPMPITAPSFQIRLDFGTSQNWGWGAVTLYTSIVRGGK